MQARLKLTRDGRLTLSRSTRDHLGIRLGDTLIADTELPGRVLLRAAPEEGRAPRNDGIEKFLGCLRNDDGIQFTIEEINEAISDGWAGKR